MAKAAPISYTIRLPYTTCETLINNETVSRAIADKRKIDRKLQWRAVDGKCVPQGERIDLLKPGQSYKERSTVVDPHAGRMQRAYGFHAWRQDFNIEKTGENTATCTDKILWEQTQTEAKRTYTIYGSGDAAVLMACNPWVINLKNIPVMLESMIRGRMEKEMNAADAQFPEICESAARRALRRRPAA